MSPKLRKKLKHIEARAIPFAVAFILIVAAVSTVIFIFNPDSNIVSAASVDQFNYYKTITIDYNQVPSTLTNFPVFINISSDADLASDALNTGNDIAFFDNSTNTQLHHEIEYFDGSSGQLAAWVNVSSLSSSSNTILKMCYGDSDIGSSAENIAGTWNSDFLHVYHFKNESDTIGTNDGTNNGVTFGLSSGIAGYGAYFNAAEYDYIRIGTDVHSNSQYDGGYTIVAWCNLDSNAEQTKIWDDEARISLDFYDAATYPAPVRGYHYDGTSAYQISGSNAPSNNKWFSYAWHYDTSNVELFINGTSVNTDAVTNGPDFDGQNRECSIGSRYDADGTADKNYINGTLDELWIIADVSSYSDNFLLTHYNNINNASNGGFFTIGAETTTVEGTYEISGLNVNVRYPFSGEAGNSVWATANLTMSIHSNNSGTTDNCTDIFIDFEDVDTDIVQENFSIAVKNNADGSWSGNTVQIPAADGNITINSSQWANNWCDGTNPFPIDNSNVTILVRCKIAIPSGKAANTYIKDNMKVCWKIIV